MELEYMDNTKNDHYYLDKIKTDLAFIVAHMKDVDVQELNDNEILLDSMLFRMIQISENVKKLSTEYRESENELPWNAVHHQMDEKNLIIIMGCKGYVHTGSTTEMLPNGKALVRVDFTKN